MPKPQPLRPGCYLLRYTPRPHGAAPRHYDGTLRVEHDEDRSVASGDLYLRRPAAATGPDPARGIPIFPIKAYRYYMRVSLMHRGAAPARRVMLGFELLRYDAVRRRFRREGVYRASMRRTQAPEGYPSPEDFLRGKVRDPMTHVVGTLTMGWVSPHLRRATVEIDRVAESEPALTNTAGLGWRQIFAQVGWDVSVDESDADLAEPSGESWSNAELHAAMLARRDGADLDREWRYWLICVRRADRHERGIMFDYPGSDSNNVPREGAAMATHWIVPDEDPWGLIKGLRFGTATDAYFRAAVHEIGHAMGLDHDQDGACVMRPSDGIALDAVPPQQFPENIEWSFSADNQRLLRHWPDVTVRPGGMPIVLAGPHPAPTPPADATEPDGVELEVRPLLTVLPLGAPVRVDLRLSRREPIPLPADLSIGARHVSGTVTDPAGTVRSFRSIIRSLDPQSLTDAAEVTGSMTLLRGADGALFPMPGPHTIHVDVRWDVEGVPLLASGERAVMVTGAVDEAHAEAALRVLTTPDALLALALGGDHLTDGIDAIGAALDNDVLRPHFAYVEAKRVAARFFGRPANPGRAAELLARGDAVMSAAEARKAATFS